jgi:lipoate---protein ligase
MLFIHSSDNHPYFNLAAEEYLLSNTDEEVFMLWRSDPVVVVGKHQNTLAEINYAYVRAHNIAIARRLTGGGTVYHDQGNINFTFIRNGEPGKLIDFNTHLAPVTGFLNKQGIEAVQGPKHEILVQGKKISGNAEHIYRNRILHHGTLLYHADLDTLRETIKPGGGRYIDRAVQSNRSSVMNLAGCMSPAPDIQVFCELFMQEIRLRFSGEIYSLGKPERLAIQKLAEEKYGSWEWIFGWSPDYEYHYECKSPDTVINIVLSTHKGIITGCRLTSDRFPEGTLDKLAAGLVNTPHQEHNIRSRLKDYKLDRNTGQEDFEKLVFSFFT